MSFLILVAIALLVCIISVALAVMIPRKIFAALLRNQLRQDGGHIFTPDGETWQGYLARTASPAPMLSVLLYAGLLGIFTITDVGPGVIAANVAVGFYLLLRYLLNLLPPTYGITGKGITVISWLPNYPLGPFGSGSVFIPWQAVEICAIDNLYLIVLTQRREARVVYPVEIEEKICSFVDSMLIHRGYKISMAR